VADDGEFLQIRVNMTIALKNSNSLLHGPDSVRGCLAYSDDKAKLVAGVDDDVSMFDKVFYPGFVEKRVERAPSMVKDDKRSVLWGWAGGFEYPEPLSTPSNVCLPHACMRII
jgi:hypothetical protein